MVTIRPLFTATLALAFALPFAAQANHDTAAPGSSGHGGHVHAPRPELGASAAYDAKGTLWAVYKDGEHVRLRSSKDDGATWSQPVTVNAVPEAVGAEGDARPRVALGGEGEIYVTWTRPMTKPYTGEIRFARSLDGGRTFSQPIVVHSDRQEITHRFDSLAVNTTGEVFVAWVDKRDIPQGEAAKSYRGAAVYYAVSSDHGASFRGDWRVAEHSCECCRVALTAQPDGTVTALWRHVFEGGVRDHAMARLGDDGKVSAFTRATHDDWQIDGCPHHGPSIARDDSGTLHAVWFTGAPGNEGVQYGRLVNGRVEGQRRIGGDTAEHADLAVSGKRVAIAWKEFDGTESHLRAMRSDDAGRTWREIDLAETAGMNDQPRVLVHGDTFRVLWNSREQPLRVVALP